MLKKFFVVLFFTSLKIFVSAQNINEFSSWAAANHQVKVSKKFFFQIDEQIRHRNLFSDFSLYAVRAGVFYQLNKEFSTGGGYSFFHTINKNESLTNESRLYEQFLFTKSLPGVKIENRFRAEQRWIYSTGWNYLNRLRNRFMFQFPLAKSLIETNTLFLVFYDEFFMNIVSKPFDQNRIFGGIGYKFSEYTQLQTGFLRAQFSTQIQKFLQITFSYNFDFSNKE